MSGKIDASLNAKLESVKWGEYRIGDLFEKITTKKLPYKAKELPTSKEGEYILPCLTSSFKNQGLNYYVPKDGATILKNVISIPSNSDVYRAYYQSNEFTVLSDAYAIKWKDNNNPLSPQQYLFFTICINKVTDLSIYSYKNKLGWNIVRNKIITLPIINNNIDFEFMDTFIAKIEAERIAKIDNYLKCSNLSNLEQQMMEKFNHLSWGEYRLDELFEIQKTSSYNTDSLVDGNEYDYITRTSMNQGVMRTTGFIGKEKLNPAGVWSLGLLQMDFFYRNREWYAGQFIRKIVPKFSLTPRIALFMTTLLNKQKRILLSVLVRDIDDTFNNLTIKLPVNNGSIDYDFIEKFIAELETETLNKVKTYFLRGNT